MILHIEGSCWFISLISSWLSLRRLRIFLKNYLPLDLTQLSLRFVDLLFNFDFWVHALNVPPIWWSLFDYLESCVASLLGITVQFYRSVFPASLECEFLISDSKRSQLVNGRRFPVAMWAERTVLWSSSLRSKGLYFGGGKLREFHLWVSTFFLTIYYSILTFP